MHLSMKKMPLNQGESSWSGDLLEKKKYASLAKDKEFHLVLYHIKSDLQRLYLGKKKSNHCIYLKINKFSTKLCLTNP